MSAITAPLRGQDRANSITTATGQTLSLSRARAALLALTFLYASVFAGTYVEFTYERYAYLGFGYDNEAAASILLRYFVLVLIPAFWMPLAMDRPSRVFLYLQYFLVYIPALWMIAHANPPILRGIEQAQLSLALLVAIFTLIWAQNAWPLLRVKRVAIPPKAAWLTIYVATAMCLTLLAVLFRDNFQLVSLAEIYTVRDVATDIIERSGSRSGAYAFAWLSNLFLPLLFSRAAQRRSIFGMAVVTAIYVFLFGIWGSKAALFGPALLAAAYYFASQPPTRMPILFLLALIAALIVPVILLSDEGLIGLIKSFWIAVVHMRTFAVPGQALVQYVAFFDEHARTFGSHISGLNLLIRYPYELDVPQTVGYYYYGSIMTANANFWAQDGIAGFGLFGLVGMSLVTASVLWLLDSVSQHLSRQFMVVALVGILLTFTNVSLFTTLLTGGLGLLMLTCLVLPPSDRNVR